MIKDRIRLALNFDVKRLKEDLSLFEDTENWYRHFITADYDGEWQIIPLRGSADAEHPTMLIYSNPICTDFKNTPWLDKCNYLPEVLASFQCNLQSVRLMKLTPGSIIKEHKDYDLDAEIGYARLHVPIQTNPSVEFYLNHERVVLKEGECWYLRLSEPHSVENKGVTDRVHLVIDAQVNAWLKAFLQTDTVPAL